MIHDPLEKQIPATVARHASLLAVTLALAAGNAQAADATWTGATDSHWSATQTGNWLNGVIAGQPDNVIFDGNTANGTVTLDRFMIEGSFNLNSGLLHDITLNPGTDGVIIQNQPGTGINIAADSRDFTINTQYALWGNVTWDIGAERTLTLNGNAHAGNGITKTGAGTAVLAVQNDYAGGTTINGGTLQIGHAAALGSGNVTFGGGTLKYGSGITSDLSGQFKNSTAAVAIDDNGQNITFGAIGSSNTGGLTKTGTGTLTLSAASSYSGATTVNGGTLKLQGGNMLVTPTAVTAESYYAPDNRAPGTTIDGSGMSSPVTVVGYNGATTTSTAGTGAASSMWLSNGHPATWITYDLGSEQTVTGFHLWNYNEAPTSGVEPHRGVNNASIWTETSLTGGADVGTYIQDMTFTAGTGAAGYTGADYTFNSPLTARYIQIYANNNFPGADNYTGLAEIRFEQYSNSNLLPTATALSIASGASLDLNTASQTVGSLADGTGGGGSITNSGATASTLTLNPTSGSTGFSGAIGGGSSNNAIRLVKSGAGTQVLAGTNTYTGTTTVSAGVLAVDGSLANTSTTIGGAGRLQGSGSIGGAVTVQSGGTLAAGNSIESFATGALSLEVGSTFAYEMNNAAEAGAAGDLTAVTGNLTLDVSNQANLTLAELGSGSWSAGDKLTLISYTGEWNGGLFNYGGTLADDTQINFSGTDWLFNYNDTTPGTNYPGDLTGSSFVTMTAIPEPHAALLGGLGLFGLLRRRRNV